MVPVLWPPRFTNFKRAPYIPVYGTVHIPSARSVCGENGNSPSGVCILWWKSNSDSVRIFVMSISGYIA